MLVIAVTGGIGSGKSTAINFFKKRGVPVIDTDQISRELVEPGSPALDTITSTFGIAFLRADGSLNRFKLREHIFSNNKEREKLQAILHPLIYQEVLNRLSSISAPYCLIVIPLLAETGNNYPHNRVLVIDVDPDTQVQRTMARDHIDEPTVNRILDTQVSREQRLALATDIIDNTGSLEQLSEQVNTLHEKYMQLAKEYGNN